MYTEQLSDPYSLLYDRHRGYIHGSEAAEARKHY